MLSIQELHKTYKRHPVLRSVSLNLLPGSVHGLVGANDAGKTTLINCLYGMLNDYQGEVRETNGLIVWECTGLLPYKPCFYPSLTGREYVYVTF